MSADYRTLNHSTFLRLYHIIFVVKYRKKRLKKDGDEIKQFVFESEKNLTLNFRKWKLIRITFILRVASVPKISPLQIVRKLKQETTVRIGKLHPELKKQFWKEKTFWSDGYFCCSIGNASIETVRKTIEEQG